MSARFAQTFDALRPTILDRLVEVRATIDHSYADLPEHLARDQFDSVLVRMQAYLRDRDVDKFRSFASRWVAMRIGEGYSAEKLIHSVVAIGDVTVQVAKHRLASDPDMMVFVREVVRVNFIATRLVVDNLAEELARRVSQRQSTERRGL